MSSPGLDPRMVAGAAAAVGLVGFGIGMLRRMWLGFLGPGVLMLVAAGVVLWIDLDFRASAVEADGRVVRMLRDASPSSSGGPAATFAPVFAFTLPDGRKVEVVSRNYSYPPCCRTGQAVRVRYDPAQPEQAEIVGNFTNWIVFGVLALVGTIFTGVGLALRAIVRRIGAMAGRVQEVPLVGMRRSDGPEGPRWIVQARWTNPASGASRLFESDPLPFDPVPQMRGLQRVRVIFDPAWPEGAYAMDLSFLHAPAP